jgi:hypothetical protein
MSVGRSRRMNVEYYCRLITFIYTFIFIGVPPNLQKDMLIIQASEEYRGCFTSPMSRHEDALSINLLLSFKNSISSRDYYLGYPSFFVQVKQSQLRLDPATREQVHQTHSTSVPTEEEVLRSARGKRIFEWDGLSMDRLKPSCRNREIVLMFVKSDRAR